MPLAQPDARPKGEKKTTLSNRSKIDEVKIEVWVIGPNTRKLSSSLLILIVEVNVRYKDLVEIQKMLSTSINEKNYR